MNNKPKMRRKRKVPVINEEKENGKDIDMSSEKVLLNNGPIYTIMSKVQLNETFHKKYIKDLKQLYEKVPV